MNHFDPNKHLPISWSTIPYLIWDIVDSCWPNKGVEFCIEHPREEGSGPFIAWHVDRRVPGLEGVETHRERHRSEELQDDGRSLETFGQNFDVIYQFDIYSAAAQEAIDLAEEFEDLMFTAKKILKMVGVSQWLFYEQLSDTLNQDTSRNTGTMRGTRSPDLYRRTLCFRAVYEYKRRRSSSTIGQIILNLFGSELIVESEPITHGEVDTLSKTNASKILQISDSPTLPTEVTSAGYLPGVDGDYTLEVDERGVSTIAWAEFGKQPSVGQTIYVTYCYREIVQPYSGTVPETG